MKRFCKLILVFFLVNVLTFNLVYADNIVDDTSTEINSTEETEIEKSEPNKSNVPIELEGDDITIEKVESGIEDIANKGENLAYTIVQQISDKSLPVCAILILWGAVLYFILGIRNLYKKRQGLLLMWGAFTFVVIAKIMNFAFWFAFMR